MNKNYVLAQSFNTANVQDRIYYAMTEDDKTALKTNEKVIFGDKVYVIATKKVYIMGNDDTWYEM